MIVSPNRGASRSLLGQLGKIAEKRKNEDQMKSPFTTESELSDFVIHKPVGARVVFSPNNIHCGNL